MQLVAVLQFILCGCLGVCVCQVVLGTLAPVMFIACTCTVNDVMITITRQFIWRMSCGNIMAHMHHDTAAIDKQL